MGEVREGVVGKGDKRSNGKFEFAMVVVLVLVLV